MAEEQLAVTSVMSFQSYHQAHPSVSSGASVCSISWRAQPVPAGHHSVQAHPQLVEGLQDAAGHSWLQQQRHAGRERLCIGDQISG